MNILFLTPRDSGNNLGGVERHVGLLTEELERRGHEVKELSLDEVNKSYKGYKNYKEKEKGEKDQKDKKEKGKSQKDKKEKGKSQKDKKEKGKSQKDRKVGKFRAWRYLWENRELLRWADIIHVHDVFWWVLPFLPLIWRDKNYKSYKGYKNKLKNSNRETPWHTPRSHPIFGRLFVTFHGWEGRCPPTKSGVWQKRLAAFLSDGTIGVGSFFEKWYGVKTDRVVWGAIDQRIARIAKFSENHESVDSIKDSPWHTPGRILPTRQGRALAFFGRLEEVNGIEIVIEAAKRLNKSYKEYKDYKDRTGRHLETSSRSHPVLFIGNGSWRKEAEEAGEVTGMGEEPWKYLVDAEVVIASSYLAILEAAAMGKKIIAVANNPLKKDYLEGHPLKGYFRVVKDVEGLIREIREIGEFYKGPTPMLHRGRTFAIGQTAEKLGDEYEKLWRIRGEG